MITEEKRSVVVRYWFEKAEESISHLLSVPSVQSVVKLFSFV